MLKAKKPDQSRYVYMGKVYRIEDVYPTKGRAMKRAEGLRTLQGRAHMNNYTRAIVVDLGKEAGRLRYAVFIAKGRPI